MATHVLFESASGYAIFEVNQVEEIGAKTKEVQASIQDVTKFSRMVTLKSFDPFKSAADALQNINDISEGECLLIDSSISAHELLVLNRHCKRTSQSTSRAQLITKWEEKQEIFFV